jgi:hypothetical protein
MKLMSDSWALYNALKPQAISDSQSPLGAQSTAQPRETQTSLIL